MDLQQDLNEEFGNFCINVDKKILEKSASLCAEYDLSAEDLVYGWVAYSAEDGRSAPTEARLDAMVRAKLLLKQRRPSTTPNSTTPGPEVHAPKIYTKDTIDQFNPTANAGMSPFPQSLKRSSSGGLSTTPKRSNTSAETFHSSRPTRSALFSPTSYSPTSAVSCERYNSRSCRGDVIASYGTPQLPSAAPGSDPSCVHVQLDEDSCCLSSCYGYMFETVQERANVLSEHILQLGQTIRDQNRVEHVAQPHAVTQEPVYAVGSVVCDGRGRLNSGSVLLSGGRGVYGQSRSVQLDLSQIQDSGVFPGQVVMVRGVNPTGNHLYASELFTSALPPLPDVPSLDHNISVMVACGPFTTAEDIQYDPLKDLLTEVRSRRPHVLLLQGPFIDNRIVENELAETFEQLWKKLLCLIDEAVEGLNTRVMLQSSVTDLHSEPVFPTPAFACTESRSTPLLLPSPASVSLSCERDVGAEEPVAGVHVAALSADVLMHLSQQELKLPGSGSSDRLARLCGYLLQQRNFYPLFPADSSLGVDLKHWSRHCTMPRRPHLLILPSEFRGFVKEVHGTVVVNPSRLVRGSSGGTYAIIDISAEVSTQPRISAQILKI